MRRALAASLCFAIAAMCLHAADKVSVVNSPHDLSITGPGPVTSQRSDVCIFCHTPHNSDVDLKPLWNRHLQAQIYDVYSSSTMHASAQQPGERSKLCLGCHDGTVALGQTTTEFIPTQGYMSFEHVLGTDLRNDHPISFDLVDDGQLATTLFRSPPSTRDPAVKLVGGRVECTTCHEPHMANIDAVANRFLVRSNSQSTLCLSCHDTSRPQPNLLNGWDTAVHATATNTAFADGLGANYGTVGANACLSCHLPHNAPEILPQRLLRNIEEGVCFNCHAGTGVSPGIANLYNEFTKVFSHPTLQLIGLHDAGENAFPLNGNRHAECEDCHNPHTSLPDAGGTIPPTLTLPQKGTSGVDSTTGVTALRPATNQYETCFKCHANSTGKPQATAGFADYGRTPQRLTNATSADPYNARLEFNSVVARHPVTQPRRHTSTELPSLRPAMLKFDGSQGRMLGIGAYIYCSDCHGNDEGRASGGVGPNGPHGSNWPHLLERRYDLEPATATPGGGSDGISYVPGLTGSAALCQKCHDVDGNILLDRSFHQHNRHIITAGASCSSCHDSHGISGGNSTNNFSMVNFDLSMVGPSSSGILRFDRTGTFAGRCYLRCHGEDHNPRTY